MKIITKADRKTEQTDIHGLTDCDFCKERNCEDCEGDKDTNVLNKTASGKE